MRILTSEKRNAIRRKDRERFEKRLGFTLVELLTVIAIIGMLSAISIMTVRASIQSAKETQTRTTIAKIDSALTEIYEKYQYRRADLSLLENVSFPQLKFKGTSPINLADFVSYDLTNSPAWNVGANSMVKIRALTRVVLLREMLRCDMPCTVAEVRERPFYSATMTPLQQAYASNAAKMGERANAELLYLIVMNANPEARSNFSDREVADIDGNGLFEFVDGWGNPICWMRWAPGLEYSDRQPVVADLKSFGMDVQMDADPFDPLGVADFRKADIPQGWSADIPQGWFLVPYVFSAGPDGEYGLQAPGDGDVIRDPFLPAFENIGEPLQLRDEETGETIGTLGTHKDNIDNHTLVR